MTWIALRAFVAGVVAAVAFALIFAFRTATCTLAYACHVGAASCTPPTPIPCGAASPNVLTGGVAGLAVAALAFTVQLPWRRSA